MTKAYPALPVVVGYTMPQLAKKLGVHRTTLKRMEDRGIIDKPGMINKPVRGRFYTEADAAKVEADIDAYFALHNNGITLVSATEIKE